MTPPTPDLADTRLRRIAGAGALTYLASVVAAVVTFGPPTVHEGQKGIEHSLAEVGLARGYAGLYVVGLGLLALLPVMLFLAHALAESVGHRSPGAAWAARTAASVTPAYVVLILGVGAPAGAAALWGLHHDLDLPTVLAINNVRNFAYFAVTLLMGAYALGVGVAAIADGRLTRWVGWGGVVVGVACLLAVPAAGVGVQYAQPLWLLWWLGVGVTLLRRLPAAKTPELPAREPRVRHA